MNKKMFLSLFGFMGIWLLFMPTLLTGQLPPGTKGTLKLEVEVEDELGIDTISKIIKLENIQASEIEPFIKARLSRWGAVQVNDALNMMIITDKKMKVEDLVDLVKKLDVKGLKDFLRLQTLSIPLNYTAASGIKSLVEPQLSSEGKLLIDDDHNALVITDVKSKIDTIKNIIEQIDTFILQVIIEVKIVEISGDYLSKTGIDWSALNILNASGNVSLSKSKTQNETYGTSQKSTYGPNWQVSGYFDLSKLSNFINLLENENRGKILSNTRIVTANNKQGRITAGERISYNLESTSGSGEYISRTTGISLNVTPRIGKENVITLGLSASLDNLTGWNPDGAPIILDRSVNSTVVLKDGETFVLGGFEKKTTVETEKGIPILRSILPFLFSRRVKSEIKNEIIIFLTPFVKRELGYSPEKDLEKLK